MTILVKIFPPVTVCVTVDRTDPDEDVSWVASIIARTLYGNDFKWELVSSEGKNPVQVTLQGT